MEDKKIKKVGRPKGNYYTLDFNEDRIPEIFKLAIYKRDGHVIFGHPDMLVECIQCNELKNQIHYTVNPHLDRFGRKKIKNICRECELFNNKIVYELKKIHGPAPNECMLCESVIKSGKKADLDHNHKTNEYRGWLCHEHNLGLAKFQDDPFELIKGIKYLSKDSHLDKREIVLKLRALASELENA